MITVSDSFKEAIKNANREIYGYVDVKYQNKTFDTSVSKIPTSSPLTTINGITKENKVLQKYASLENNYTLLDGSFMVWNENNVLESGYISDDVFENIDDNEIIVTNNSTNISTKGVTIYFKENLPLNFTVVITTQSDTIVDEVVDNQSYVYQYILPEKTMIDYISIYIDDVEFPKNRIRIASVDFNLSDFYEGDMLVGFDVTEEIDLLVENLPINTCSVRLNNYPDVNGDNKFDPISPTSIIKYLTSDATIKPYIGVLTEDRGIEYVPMGVFYINDWSSDADGNVTINGNSLMAILKNITIHSDGTFLRNSFTGEQIGNYFTSTTGYDFNFSGGTYYNNYLRDTNLLNWILAQMPFQIMWYDSELGMYHKRKFYISRYNVATEDNLRGGVVDYLSRKELKSDVKYETKSVINKVEVTDITNYNITSSTREDVVKDTHVLTSQEEYQWYYFNKYTGYSDSSFSYTSTGGATATLIDKNYYMIYVKFNGNVGDTVTITYNGYVYDDPPTKVHTKTNSIPIGETLSLDFSKYFDANDSSIETSMDYYLTMDNKYKVTMETIGDPSLEVGDTISVQTRYENNGSNGYKNVIITKQSFKYDGGLECSIEARGN